MGLGPTPSCVLRALRGFVLHLIQISRTPHPSRRAAPIAVGRRLRAPAERRRKPLADASRPPALPSPSEQLVRRDRQAPHPPAGGVVDGVRARSAHPAG